ncbi:MAG TPA: hypothetical protein VFU72_02820, partial [Nitrolancea sp.]|nr:hypothetical protein [Nitrolancea sp.]
MARDGARASAISIPPADARKTPPHQDNSDGGPVMSRKPRTAKALEVAAKPVEVVGQALERAFDPLTSTLKRAALKRADKQARQFAQATTAAPTNKAERTDLMVSPLAVPFP